MPIDSKQAYDDPNDPKQSFALVDVRPLVPSLRSFIIELPP